MGIIIQLVGEGGLLCCCRKFYCVFLDNKTSNILHRTSNDCGILQCPSGIVAAVSLDSTLSYRVYQFGIYRFYHTDFFSIFTLPAAKCRTVFVTAT